MMYDEVILEYEGEFGRGRNIDTIVSMVESLPPLPGVAARALKLLDDTDTTAVELAEVLGRDPAYALATLRAANSAALGRSETVCALDQAIMLVGLTTLKSILLAVTIKKWNRGDGELEKLVWEKSLGTAVAAQVVASQLGKSYQSEAHLCGLLHNVGQIVMLSYEETRRDYQDVLGFVRENQVDYAEAERAIIGFSYPLVGSLVARRWQLPFSTCVCILRHDDPFEGIGTKIDEQIAFTKLAAAMSLCAGFGRPEGHPLACPTLQTVALAIGFEAETLATDMEVMNRQIQALYATEASAYAG